MVQNDTSPDVAPATDYKSTLNLPRTPFDMKANLTTREPLMLAAWRKENLYEQIRRRPHPAGKWVLHDGPPYANGDIHMGHLSNKVLKDIIVRFRTMQGHDSPYVPGWDCHGLPIESAVQKALGPKMRAMPAADVRRLCRDYAMKFVNLQSETFQRLGIFGEFDRPYLTLDPAYEGGIMDVLAELVQRDLVYRQKKTVHWCTFDRTALAEAELEYADRRDQSIYVQFQLDTNTLAWPMAWGEKPPVAHLLIWTTTPWTLPANRAVAIHPERAYVAVRFTDGSPRVLIVAANLAGRVMELRGVADFAVSEPIGGDAFIALGPKYFHPFDPSLRQDVLPADYVTAEDGTGLVHIAPGHGAEDYQIGRKFGLDIYCPVLDDGRYDATAPAWLAGKSIWESNLPIVEHLRDAGALYFSQEFSHSYPHCWRCKKAIIFRATEQWFVRAGQESPLLAKARESVQRVQWFPAWGQKRIAGMLETRPDWCISRQRVWGVPIPAFFDDQGRILFTERSVRRVGDYMRQHGSDAWFEHTPAQILGAEQWADAAIGTDGALVPDVVFQTGTLRKGADILDVWFESGASHHAVLECTHPELGYPAEMYLEGSDQHRGWFQSSLLEASGYRAEPPFRQVLTHGFIVDANGKKMAKSEGNDIKVVDALKQYGADVLRLWAASVDYQNDMPCSQDLLARTGESYRKVRNTIRYLLGNLYDFDSAKDAVKPEPHSVDALILHRFRRMALDFNQACERYEFHLAFRDLYTFCSVDISAVYAKAIKDRLYCDLPASARRRASQTVCCDMLVSLVAMLAPVLVFTAEEAWQAIRQLPGMADRLPASVHLFIAPPPVAPSEDAAIRNWERFTPMIDKGLKQLDDLKRTTGMGNALDAQAVFVVPKSDSLAAEMDRYGPEMEDMLGVGSHRVEHGEIWDIAMHDMREVYKSCARSWKRRPDVGSDPAFPDLSARDAAVLRQLGGKKIPAAG